MSDEGLNSGHVEEEATNEARSIREVVREMEVYRASNGTGYALEEGLEIHLAALSNNFTSLQEALDQNNYEGLSNIARLLEYNAKGLWLLLEEQSAC